MAEEGEEEIQEVTVRLADAKEVNFYVTVPAILTTTPDGNYI